MWFEPTAIPDVVLVTPRVFGDERGFFLEQWNLRKFSDAGLPSTFVQTNLSRSARHTLRGLHFQVVQPQGKLVTVLTGTVFDVAVDLREESPTYGRWVGVTLDASTRQALWVPPRFAHGFLVLSESADFLYHCTDFYAPEYERSIRWNDAELRIDWPLPNGVAPLLSGKDVAGGSFHELGRS